MTRERWFWPGILSIPAVGLVIQEILAFSAMHLGDDSSEQARTAVGWGLWVALPYVAVGVLMLVAVRRNRLAWWLSLGAGVLVTLIGLGFAISFYADTSTDPLAGLNWVIAPVAQLVTVGGIGVGIVLLTLIGRRTNAAPTELSRQ